MDENNDKGDKKDVGAITAGLVGAAVGAAVAAGSIALSNEKNRKKVEKLLSEIKDRGSQIMELIQKEVGRVKKITSTRKPNSKKSKKS